MAEELLVSSIHDQAYSGIGFGGELRSFLRPVMAA